MTEIVSSSDYANVFGEILNLSTGLKNIVQRYSAEVLKRQKESGARYDRAVVNYVRGINQLESERRDQITVIAGQITALAGEGWQEKREIVALWHYLAVATTHLSEHPSKKVATLFIDKENRFLSYGVNQVPPGVNKFGAYYEKGARKDFIVCSERMGMAKIFDVNVHVSHITLKDKDRMALVRESIRNFSDDIATNAGNSDRLRESYAVSTTTPCNSCIPVMIPAKPKGIFADARAGKDYTRDVGFDRVKEVFAKEGIPLFNLAL